MADDAPPALPPREAATPPALPPREAVESLSLEEDVAAVVPKSLDQQRLPKISRFGPTVIRGGPKLLYAICELRSGGRRISVRHDHDDARREQVEARRSASVPQQVAHRRLGQRQDLGGAGRGWG